MRMCKSLQVSHAVFATAQLLINEDEKAKVDRAFYLACFDNCREQGFVAQGTQYNIAVVEHKNSDLIIVYEYPETAHPSNLPKGGLWPHRSFSHGDVSSAAQHVATLLIAHATQKEAKNDKA